MKDRYNNHITYNTKWNTEENLHYVKLCHALIDDRVECMSDIPLSWAKEVHELLSEIEDSYGITYNLGAYGGFYVSTRLRDLFIHTPLKRLFHRPKKIFQKSLFDTITSNIRSFFYSYKYAIKVTLRNTRGSVYNRVRKPAVSLSQVKEKYGHLTIYFSAPEGIEDHINHLICLCEVKLAKKEAYYPLSSLKKQTTSTYANNVEIKTTTYRTANGKRKRFKTLVKYPYKSIIEKK